MSYTNRPDELSGPLSGIRVVDFTRVLSGPYCTMLLGDYGADVIKIERPDGGDDTRSWAPPYLGSESVYFLTINRNKRSVAIDLSNPQGRDLAARLIAEADVVVENFRPDVMEGWGLDYESVKETNPRLVYCSMTGYGSRGPRRMEAGYDAFMMARGGLMDITGERGGAPVRPGVAVLDIATGVAAHGAIVSALLARERTGRGQHVELSLFAMQIAMLVNTASNYLMAGQVATRWGSEHPSIVPYRAYRAADGYLMMGALNQHFWSNLCRAMDLEELEHDPRFATNADRVAHRDELNAIIEERLTQRTVAEWVADFETADVPAAPINNVAQALTDPQVEALGLIRHFDHPDAGRIPIVGPVAEFEGTPLSIRRPAPMLGEHTDEVLGEVLGLGSEELQTLREQTVIV